MSLRTPENGSKRQPVLCVEQPEFPQFAGGNGDGATTLGKGLPVTTQWAAPSLGIYPNGYKKGVQQIFKAALFATAQTATTPKPPHRRMNKWVGVKSYHRTPHSKERYDRCAWHNMGECHRQWRECERPDTTECTLHGSTDMEFKLRQSWDCFKNQKRSEQRWVIKKIWWVK